MPLVYEELSYHTRGALYEVYNTLGPGFREETYKIAIISELQQRGIPVARENVNWPPTRIRDIRLLRVIRVQSPA